MNSYLDYYYNICNKILELLRAVPDSLKYNAFYDRFTEKLFIAGVQSLFGLNNDQFKDVLAILKEDGYVTILNDTIDITEAGRKFSITTGYKVEHFEINMEEMEQSENGLVVPKGYYSKKEKEIKFTHSLTDPQKTKLIKFLKDGNYIEDAENFVKFINGLNDGSSIVLKGDEIANASILIEHLMDKGKLKLSYGNGPVKFFEMHINPFSLQPEKRQQIKSAARKKESGKWKKAAKNKEFQKFLDSFPAIYLLYLLYYFK